MTSRPITPVTLTGWHLALGLGPLVTGDGPAGIHHLLEGRAAFIAPHEELVGSGVDHLAPGRRLALRGCLTAGGLPFRCFHEVLLMHGKREGPSFGCAAETSTPRQRAPPAGVLVWP